MFSRVLSKGFFRQGFPGWYRGKFSEVVPSNPGTFTLAILTAEFMLDDETAGFELETMTPTFTLERQF